MMMSQEIDVQKTKAIVFEDNLLVEHNENGIISPRNNLSVIIEIIKKANERNIPVIIRCEELVKIYNCMEKIFYPHNATVMIVDQEDFTLQLLLRHKLGQEDCLFVTNSNLNILSKAIENMPLIIEKNTGFLSSAKAIQQFGLSQEIQTSQGNSTSFIQQKIPAIVFEDDLFTLSQNYSYKIANIIQIANDKNIPAFILCTVSNSDVKIKELANAYKINVIIKDQFDFNKMLKISDRIKKDDCLYVTLPQNTSSKTDTNIGNKPKKILIHSEKDFDQLSITIENQSKNILLPENILLAKNMTFIDNLENMPSVTLKNEHQLFITLGQINTEFSKKCKTYNPDLDENTTTIEIKSRAQIEKFVKHYGGDIVKLYNDVDLKYSLMPEVIQAIVVEHDVLIQFPKHNEENAKPVPHKFQLNVINIIKKAFQKNIPVIVRCSGENFFGDLSKLLYTLEYKFSWETLPILNQSEFKVDIKKKYDLNKDDFLYIAIDGGTLYKTETSHRTHVLLISSENDINYLSEQIDNHDANMLLLEKMRIAKNVRDNCNASKMPSIQLVNPDSLHIITCDKENNDAWKIAEQYKKQYGKDFVELDKSGKIVKIASKDIIEKFVEDHRGNVKELYEQAGMTFDNSYSCSQQ